MNDPVDRILFHLDSGERRVVDPTEVYYLEVLDEATRVRLRSARALIDTRPAHEVLSRDCAINLDHIQTIARSRIGRRLTTLGAGRMVEVQEALLFALGLDDSVGSGA